MSAGDVAGTVPSRREVESSPDNKSGNFDLEERSSDPTASSSSELDSLSDDSTSPSRKQSKRKWCGAKLRMQALQAVQAGKTYREVADQFHVHPGTLSKWKQRFQETGNVETRRGTGKRCKLTEEERERLVEFFRQHPDATNEQGALIAGWKIHPRSVSNYLRRAGIKRIAPYNSSSTAGVSPQSGSSETIVSIPRASSQPPPQRRKVDSDDNASVIISRPARVHAGQSPYAGQLYAPAAPQFVPSVPAPSGSLPALHSLFLPTTETIMSCSSAAPRIPATYAAYDQTMLEKTQSLRADALSLSSSRAPVAPYGSISTRQQFSASSSAVSSSPMSYLQPTRTTVSSQQANSVTMTSMPLRPTQIVPLPARPEPRMPAHLVTVMSHQHSLPSIADILGK